MLSILCKKFLFQFRDAVEVTVSIELCTFFHGSERSPALRIYDICVFESLCHIVCFCEGTAGFFSIVRSNGFYFREYFVSLRMSQDNIHPKTCHQTDDTLGNGQRFSVRRRVSPCHGQFFALQILNAAELVDDMKHICHRLCRVVDVALQIHKCRFLFQNAVFIALCYRVNHFMHIGISLADVHIIADTDNVSHERDHICCLADGLAVGYLRFPFVQILNFESQQVAGGSKRKTGTCRIIAEK